LREPLLLAGNRRIVLTRSSNRRLIWLNAALLLGLQSAGFGQAVVLRDAPKIAFPSKTDSNSPCHWDGDTLYLFNSEGHPVRSKGPDQFHLAGPVDCPYDTKANGGRWIECTWRADDGTLYGWYHHEPSGLCPGTHLTAPKIGAARSSDNGLHWTDLGIILEAPPNTIDCGAKNGYFAGGNGDFCCMLDSKKRFVYFFISTYTGSLAEQGVSVARMSWLHRDSPVGKVWKYREGKWDQPGIGGRVSAILPAKISWMRGDADAFWGPAVHWNTYLQCYVMLLNRARYKPGWPQEGVYVSFSKDVGDPASWTEPRKILSGGSWYPEVIGVDSRARETDRLVGRQARFYTGGVSKREMIFFKEGEDTSKLPPVHEPSK